MVTIRLAWLSMTRCPLQLGTDRVKGKSSTPLFQRQFRVGNRVPTTNEFWQLCAGRTDREVVLTHTCVSMQV